MAEAEIVEGWYVAHDDELDGPISDRDLVRGFELGRFKPEHYIWRQGMDLWLEAGELPQLARIQAARKEPVVKAAIDKRAAERREVKAERVGQKNVARQARRAEPGGNRTKAPRRNAYESTPEAETPAAGSKPVDLKDMFETLSKKGDWQKILKLGKSWPQIAIAAVVLGLMFPPLIPVIVIAAFAMLKMKSK